MIEQPIRKPELLCPAGSFAALLAAIEGGADAVYLGGVGFNARIHAKNFTSEELREGIALAHAYGVKIYITANTLIYDREIDSMLRAAEDAYLCGADALILADMGCARLIRDRIPIALHASTQLSGHGADAARLLREAGFSRMVCAREMGREELRLFTQNSPIEAEVFVHGALCVCHSGQCLFSSLVGGRSGNRGECAQPCRLPFSVGKSTGYPLSLKDLSLARHIPELCDMGIASFKIEGRMKSPEYVRDVTRIWRRLMDEGRGADDRDMEELAAVFSRGGLTDGYYTGRIGHAMLGIRSENDKQTTRALDRFEGITKKLPVSLYVSLRHNEPSLLRITAENGRTVSVEGEIPQAARTAPITREDVVRSMSKLGNTPYMAKKTEVVLEEGLMLPISAMNALRRAAVQALTENRDEGTGERTEGDFSPIQKRQKGEPLFKEREGRSAVFYFPQRIPQEAYEYFDILYTPLESYDGSTNGVFLPPVIFDTEREELRRMLASAKELGAEHVLLGNAGHLALARETGLKLHGDLRLNITNGESAAVWERQGLCDWILSPELTLPQLRDIGGRSRAVVYGRIPLMVTEKCVGKEISRCESCKEGRVTLTDRRQIRFPVLREWKHRSLIVNSVPHYMADRQKEMKRMGLNGWHFIFTVETKEQISDMIRAYQKELPSKADVRRIRP